jgi:hypothetical protein
MLLEHFKDFYKFCQIGGEKQVCCDLKIIYSHNKNSIELLNLETISNFTIF